MSTFDEWWDSEGMFVIHPDYAHDFFRESLGPPG